jgi:hypothetical protein
METGLGHSEIDVRAANAEFLAGAGASREPCWYSPCVERRTTLTFDARHGDRSTWNVQVHVQVQVKSPRPRQPGPRRNYWPNRAGRHYAGDGA